MHSLYIKNVSPLHVTKEKMRLRDLSQILSSTFICELSFIMRSMNANIMKTQM